MGAQGDSVVGADDALVLQAETTSQIEAAGQGAKVTRGIGRRACEALVVVGTEAGQHNIGLRQRADRGETKFADQTVLASAPGAFDATLGSLRIGGDLLDAELLEGASELGRSLSAGELFGQSPVESLR